MALSTIRKACCVPDVSMIWSGSQRSPRADSK